jgi:uncharacterized protein YdiU (UPF0061 family)
MMLLKLGVETPTPEQYPLVDELLQLMQYLKLDYTNTFLAFSYDSVNGDIPLNRPEFKPWLVKWKNTIESSKGIVQARKIMIANNPAFIPRNHLVEEALDAADDGNTSLLEKLLFVLRKPYHYKENMGYYTVPPNQNFEHRYATYCGT